MICTKIGKAPTKIGSRFFRKWINTIFNKVDYNRIEEVGPDRAAAEWLLRCGASVRWQDGHKWITDYNGIEDGWDNKHKIVEIDATDSCIMYVGFHYLAGLKHLEKIKFIKCIYLEDLCLDKLSITKTSLKHLEVVSCGNVTDNGVLAITKLELLKTLYLYDLPEVRDREKCLSLLQKSLPLCKINFPLTTES